jgi:flagellar biosynthesis/type III secretory pathway M-ring protein FliF/YscJ
MHRTLKHASYFGGQMRLQRVFAVAILATLIAFPLALFAHHSRAHYGTEESTTTGTVIEYKWRNPHVFVVWEVKDQSGKSTQWVGEMASVTSMIADGMTKDSLKQGETVTVISFPSKNPGSTEALIKKITKTDGKVVVDNSRVPNLRQP